eukprot:TRINITY_DN9770_c0_g1_i3.p1 TRINITY_DN9770_c0_g1~~TRINITY_DN9770_c0_g1_i3.p1  ORF type:complete len:1304 (+),score=283.48 TRINITY_DN9770_c0_g1_i3:126-4037(+)
MPWFTKSTPQPLFHRADFMGGLLLVVLLSLSVHIAQTSTSPRKSNHPSDVITILRDIYVSTNLDGSWLEQRGWNTTRLLVNGDIDTIDACTWYGVPCDVQNTITSLTLGRNGLQGILPSSICDLASLTYLDVSQNDIMGTLPECLGNLTLLEHLYVSSTRFHGNLPSSMANMHRLRAIDFSQNNFDGTFPNDVVCGWASIEVINSGVNDMKGTLDPCIASLPGLTTLGIEDALLHGILPPAISTMSQLEYLWLDNNFFEGIIPDLSNLTSLVELDLSNNRFTGSFPCLSLVLSTTLSQVLLGGNMLEGELPASVCDLVDLRVFRVAGNNLIGSIPACLGNLEYTYDLDFSNNHFNGSLPNELGSLTSLKYLHLANNQLSGSLPASFSTLVHLLWLDLSSNPFNKTMMDLCGPILMLPSLTFLSIANTSTHGTLDYYLFWNNEYGYTFRNVVDMDISHNMMTGPIRRIITWWVRVAHLDLSYNLFEGEIPGTLRSFTHVDVTNNPRLFSPQGSIPSFIKAVPGSEVNNITGHFKCPILQSNDVNEFEMDPSYYNFSLCSCEGNYAGVNGSCYPCLDEADCPGGDVVIVREGYYPTPTLAHPLKLMECSHVGQTFNPCNPDRDYPYQCMKGHTGRKCSDCDAGYYSYSGRCHACSGRNVATGVSVVIVLLVAVSFVAVFRLRPTPIASASPTIIFGSGISMSSASNMMMADPAKIQPSSLSSSPSLPSLSLSLTSPPPSSLAQSFGLVHQDIPPKYSSSVPLPLPNHSQIPDDGPIAGDGLLPDPQAPGLPSPPPPSRRSSSYSPVSLRRTVLSSNAQVTSLNQVSLRLLAMDMTSHNAANVERDDPPPPELPSASSSTSSSSIIRVDSEQFSLPPPAPPSSPPLLQRPHSSPSIASPSPYSSSPLQRSPSPLLRTLQSSPSKLRATLARVKSYPISHTILAAFITSSAHTGTIKIFFNYAQTVSSVFGLRFPWPNILVSFFTGINASNLNFSSVFGYQCDFNQTSGYITTYYMYVLAPIFLLLLGGGIYLVLKTVRFIANRFLRTTWKLQYLFTDFVRYEVFSLHLCYFPLAKLIMSSFNCEQDPVTEIHYLEAAPYVTCSYTAEWGRILPFSVVLLPLYVFGFPTIILYLLWRYRATVYEDTRIRQVLGFVYLPFKSGFWWYEFVIMLRSLLLSILISLMPQSSSLRNFLIPLTLGGFFVIQVKLRPFAEDVDNRLEEISLSAIMLTFCAGMSFHGYAGDDDLTDEDQRDIMATGWIVLLVNVFVLLMFLLRMGMNVSRAAAVQRVYTKILAALHRKKDTDLK